MVSAAKAFAKYPPRRPLTDLAAVVEDFGWRYVDTCKTDQVVKFCGEAPDLATAITRAVEARDENGKHHNHQSKVDITARRKLGAGLRSHQLRRKVVRCADFDALHDLIDEVKPFGIGPVTVYDVSVRLGAYLGLEPTSVYMHAGVRQGFITLCGALYRQSGGTISHWIQTLPGTPKKVPVNMFPVPLNELKADDVEDILCTYREVFATWHE